MQEEKLFLSQKKYIEKMLERFGMLDAKPVKTPLAAHFRLSADLSPQTDEEEIYMSKSCSLCQCSWKHYVCYGMHSTGHFTCSQCRKSIYGHVGKRPLADSEMDFAIFKRIY